MLETVKYADITILARTLDNDPQDRFWDDYEMEEKPWSRGQEWQENGYSKSDFV
jgi:hypothetical protein